ncbi:GlsB/YeaQ/YmgE family stress response membrane protein [bacterium]|nr:MAG: GlsB/YeaQ/YmgE family stress response membrane protein [bacterium]
MSFLIWIVLGALAGWIASMIAGTNAQQGAIANIIVGIIGAFIGGMVMRLLGFGGVDGFNLYSLLVAVLGAVILLFGYRALSGRPAE